jgi:hypothetical protein
MHHHFFKHLADGIRNLFNVASKTLADPRTTNAINAAKISASIVGGIIDANKSKPVQNPVTNENSTGSLTQDEINLIEEIKSGFKSLVDKTEQIKQILNNSNKQIEINTKNTADANKTIEQLKSQNSFLEATLTENTKRLEENQKVMNNLFQEQKSLKNRIGVIFLFLFILFSAIGVLYFINL